MVTVTDDRKSILVVDDDPLFREGAALALGSDGYEVRSAATLEEADAHLAAQDFDLWIVDIHMPREAPLEWLRARTPAGAPLPVLLCTGFPALETAIDAVSLQVLGYVVKPFAEDALLATVRQALARMRATAGPGAQHLRERLTATQERHGLTPRQMEVLELLVAGSSNKEVAQALGCALRTVELHVSELLRRTGARSRTALLARLLGTLEEGGE